MLGLYAEVVVTSHAIIPSLRQRNSCKEGWAQGLRSQRKEVWCPSGGRSLHPPNPSRERPGISQGPGMYLQQVAKVQHLQKVWAFQCGIQSCRTNLRPSKRKSQISTYKHCPYLDYRGFVSGLIGVKHLKNNDVYGRLWKIIATNTKPSARMRDTTKNDRHFT